MTFDLAVVTALTHKGNDDKERNLADARAWVREAASRGAKLVLLPEGFPGLWHEPVDWTPVEALCDIAKESGVYVVGGFAEPLDEIGSRCYNSLVLIGPDGVEVGRYRRTTPAHAPWLHRQGGNLGGYDWTNATDLPVFDTELGKIGLLVCSEVYATELARILAVKGAELILMPTGHVSPGNLSDTIGSGYGGSLYETWKTLVWARAIENLAYTAVCTNLSVEGGKGLSRVCSPEEVILDEQEGGIHIATIDLDRVRWLRNRQDAFSDDGESFKVKPGLLRDWRRQAVFDANPELAKATPEPAS